MTTISNFMSTALALEDSAAVALVLSMMSVMASLLHVVEGVATLAARVVFLSNPLAKRR
jgi:hypothetical protein